MDNFKIDTTDYAGSSWHEDKAPEVNSKHGLLSLLGNDKTLIIDQSSYENDCLKKSEIHLDISELGMFFQSLATLMPKNAFVRSVARHIASSSPLKDRRTNHSKAYAKWTEDDDALLFSLWGDNRRLSDICRELGRSDYAIIKRLQKQQLI